MSQADYIFFGKMESGALKIINLDKVKKDLQGEPDGLVELILRHKKQRSLPQNKYYFAVVIWEIRHRLEELGNHFKDIEVHDFLKDKFNSKMIVGQGGEVLGEVGLSTKSMSKEEFGIYIEKIIQWAAQDLGLNIPPPGTKMQIDYE